MLSFIIILAVLISPCFYSGLHSVSKRNFIALRIRKSKVRICKVGLKKNWHWTINCQTGVCGYFSARQSINGIVTFHWQAFFLLKCYLCCSNNSGYRFIIASVAERHLKRNHEKLNWKWNKTQNSVDMSLETFVVIECLICWFDRSVYFH